LDRDRLRRALCAIVERHAPLRSVFVERGGEPRARALPAPDDLLVIDDGDDADRLAARIAAERRHVFDVASGPVARFALVPIAREHHVLVVNVHHLAWDALSQHAFVAELARLYA